MKTTLPLIKIIIPAALILLLRAAEPSYAAGNVKLSLSPSSGDFSSSFNARVILDTGTQKAGAVDVYLTWEPDDLDISESDISAAEGFSVAGRSVDKTKKQIDFTVYGSEEFSGSSVHLATLNFTPLKSSGTTAVDYIFKGEGEVGDSGVFYTGNDILTSVSGAAYTLAAEEDNDEDGEPEETHKECQGSSCVTVSGSGNNECSTNADCQVGGTGGTGGTSPQATTSAAPKTASGEDFTIFLALFALSLIGSGIFWALIP